MAGDVEQLRQPQHHGAHRLLLPVHVDGRGAERRRGDRERRQEQRVAPSHRAADRPRQHASAGTSRARSPPRGCSDPSRAAAGRPASSDRPACRWSPRDTTRLPAARCAGRRRPFSRRARSSTIRTSCPAAAERVERSRERLRARRDRAARRNTARGTPKTRGPAARSRRRLKTRWSPARRVALHRLEHHAPRPRRSAPAVRRDRACVLSGTTPSHDSSSERRLEPDGAARRRRNPDGAARVGADRCEAHALDERHGGAAARSAGRSRRIERMTHGSERRLLAGRAEGELVEIGLADEDRAGLAQPRDDRRVRAGIARRQRRPRRRRRAGDVDQILHGHGNAVQGAAGSGRRAISALRDRARPPGPARACTVMNALSSGRASIRARHPRTRSTGDRVPALKERRDLRDGAKVRRRAHSSPSATSGCAGLSGAGSVPGSSSARATRRSERCGPRRAARRSIARASRAAASAPAVRAAPRRHTRLSATPRFP